MVGAACKKAPDPAGPSPLKVQARKYESILPGCGDKEKREEPCVTFRVTWPEVVESKSSNVTMKINAAIMARLQAKDAPRGFAAEAAAVAEDYHRFRKEFPHSAITYFTRRTAEVLHSTGTVFSVEIDEEEFRGGAHPNSHREYLNVRPETGEEIDLASVLNPGAEAKLLSIAEAHFRADKQMEEGAKYSDAGFHFADEKFSLSRTWGIAPQGLVFHYNDYEIASYATGPTTLVLPWREIGALIRKDAGLMPAGK